MNTEGNYQNGHKKLNMTVHNDHFINSNFWCSIIKILLWFGVSFGKSVHFIVEHGKTTYDKNWWLELS